MNDGSLPGVKYRGVLHAFRTIVRVEGVEGLFKGALTASVASGLSWGLYFYFYEGSKQRYRDWEAGSGVGGAGGSVSPLTSGHHMAAAVEASAFTVVVTNPIWLIKTRLQLQVEATEQSYKGALHAVRTIIKQDGFLGLYRGMVPALLLTSHGAIQFAVYERLKQLCDQHGLSADSRHYFVMGAASKGAATLVSYPFQVVKSRLQQRFDATRVPYDGVVDCVRRTFRLEGVRGFYKGLVPNLYRVAPSSALTLVIYEKVRASLASAASVL